MIQSVPDFFARVVIADLQRDKAEAEAAAAEQKIAAGAKLALFFFI